MRRSACDLVECVAVLFTVLAFACTAVSAQAPNDLPAGAILQVGAGLQFGDNGPAFAVVDGPLGTCGLPTDDLWYFFIPTVTGVGTATTCPAALPGATAAGMVAADSVVAAFVDAGGTPGAQITCVDDACFGGFEATTSFPITAGVGLFVSVAAWGGPGNGGPFALAFGEGPPTPGDDCTTAIVVVPPVIPIGGAAAPGGAIVASFSTAIAASAGPPTSCDVVGADPYDAWFSFMATATGIAVASLCPNSRLLGGDPEFGVPSGAFSTPTDTVLAVWSAANCPPSTELVCADDSPGCGFAEPEAQFAVVAGTTYFIQVKSWGASTPVAGNLGLVVVAGGCPTPPGDTFATPIPLAAPTPPANGAPGVATYATGDNTCAATDPPFSGANPCPPATNDLWFCLTPGGTGEFVFDLSGNKHPIKVTFFAGTPPNPGAVVGSCQSSNSAVTRAKVCASVPFYFSVSAADPAKLGAFSVRITTKFGEKFTKNGTFGVTFEIGFGPPGAMAFSAITLDVLHAGIPPASSFPNGWFFGVPIGFAELVTELTWPGGAPFVVLLDGSGAATPFQNLAIPTGLGWTIWAVTVAFDPATGFATVADVTDPTAFPL